MDIGKFKSNQLRLTLWVLTPLVLVLGMGFTTYALKLQSEWQLNRTKVLSELLPRLNQSKYQSRNLIAEFHGSKTDQIKTEDEFISFLQNAAHKVGFTVNSLKVERQTLAQNKNMPVLVASVSGSGSFQAVETYIGDVVSKQYLLSESSLRISQTGVGEYENNCRVDLTFELVLPKPLELKSGGTL